MTNVMNHHLTAHHFIEYEVRIAHDGKHTNARIVSRPSDEWKCLELVDGRPDSLLDSLCRARIVLADIVSDPD